MSRAAGLATGHAPSPYLRRLRLPNLGTHRPYDTDDLSPEEEYNKLELIRARMAEKKTEQYGKTEQAKKAISSSDPKSSFYHPDNLFQTSQEKNVKGIRVPAAMSENIHEEFCDVANGSWFITKYVFDMDKYLFTYCGEAALVTILQIPLLVACIINAFDIRDGFPRFTEYDDLYTYFGYKCIAVLACVISLITSLVVSLVTSATLPLVLLIEEIIVTVVWSVVLGIWLYSIFAFSITRTRFLTISQFLASKGIMMICGHRAREFGFLNAQTIIMSVACLAVVAYGIETWIEKKEIKRITYQRMDNEEDVDQSAELNPEGDEGAGIFSKFLFLWTKSLIKRGAKGLLNSADDLFQLPPSLNVQHVESRFVESSPTYFTDAQRFSVFTSLLTAFWKPFTCLAILRLFADAFTFMGPILLRLLIEALELSVPTDDGIFLALAVISTTFASAMLNNHFNFYVSKLGMKVRTALITAIYDKLLRVPASELSPSSGQIMNYVSTDVDRVVNFCNSFHQFWALPFQLTVALFLLYRQVGKAFLAGVVMAIILIPINQGITMLIGRMSEKFMHWKDQRMKWVQEMVENIRTIKSSNLEKFFQKKIGKAREKELYYLKIRKYLDAICVYLWASAPLLIQISIFTVYVLVFHMKMTAATVYPVIALISMLIMPLNAFPWVLNGMIEAYVSLKRLERFFSLQAIDYHSIYCQNDDRRCLLYTRNGSFFWDFEDVPTLSEITIAGYSGQIIGITGDVGCGKSTLLMGFLGETRRPSGQQIGITKESRRGITYVGQERWLSRGTIRDNILMGKLYNEQLYHQVLQESCLGKDLCNFPAGDQYIISENGATLSGGQQTRVVIARALYQETSIYLFDEPFASLDSHVARQVFHTGIMNLKNRGKLVILASHDIMKLCECDHIIKLNKRGKIECQGAPSVVYPNEFNKMMLVHEEEEFRIYDDFNERVFEREEERQIGAVKANVYFTYFSAVGAFLSLMILIAISIMQITKNGSDWWLSRWTENQNNSSRPPRNVIHYLKGDYDLEEIDEEQWDRSMWFLVIYAIVAALNTVFTLIRAFHFAYGGIKAAKFLHEHLLVRLLKTTVRWWETTPSGRVVNRLCSDIYTVDDNLPFVLNIFLASLFNLFGALVVSIVGIPWIIPILLILAYFYYRIQAYYRKTTVELKRLSSVSLSPLYSHLSDSVNGLVTIRAHRYVEQFCQKLRKLLTLNLRAQYSSTAANQWLNVRLSLIAVVVVASITIAALVEHRITNKVDSGLVALAITYALSLSSLLNGLLGSFIETEKEMVSVERINEYTEGNILPQEGQHGQNQFPGELKGKIEFKDVYMRYSEDTAFALDKVNFVVKPGARAAIIGRTGSGKSSIFHALLRTSPHQDGRITIDDVDIRGLSVKLLRTIIGYIPQRPFIFSGTFYENLTLFTPDVDRNNVVTIARVAGLENLMERLGGLDGTIEEDGGNISYGEKQIISICRILLFKPKIVLVDEGTSYVDHDTHKRMTELLDTHLHHSTILSIVHNKLGIQGYTMLIEMCSGRPLFTNDLNDLDIEDLPVEEPED